MPVKVFGMLAAGALTVAVLYLSWLPDPSMERVGWLPATVGEWADGNPTLRTGVPFVPLGLLAGVWACGGGWRRWLMVGAGGIFLALVAELGQIVLPDRSFDWYDVGWAVAGGAVGMGVSLLVFSFRCFSSRKETGG